MHVGVVNAGAQQQPVQAKPSWLMRGYLLAVAAAVTYEGLKYAGLIKR